MYIKYVLNSAHSQHFFSCHRHHAIGHLHRATFHHNVHYSVQYRLLIIHFNAFFFEYNSL